MYGIFCFTHRRFHGCVNRRFRCVLVVQLSTRNAVWVSRRAKAIEELCRLMSWPVMACRGFRRGRCSAPVLAWTARAASTLTRVHHRRVVDRAADRVRWTAFGRNQTAPPTKRGRGGTMRDSRSRVGPECRQIAPPLRERFLHGREFCPGVGRRRRASGPDAQLRQSRVYLVTFHLWCHQSREGDRRRSDTATEATACPPVSEGRGAPTAWRPRPVRIVAR
jgi:hypothetical protein